MPMEKEFRFTCTPLEGPAEPEADVPQASVNNQMEESGVAAPGAPTSPPSNFAQLLDLVTASQALSQRAKITTAACIRTAAVALLQVPGPRRGEGCFAYRRQVSLNQVPCDLPWLNDKLFNTSPAQLQLSHESWLNVVSALRRALRLAGLVDPVLQTPDRSSRWGYLLAELGRDKYSALGLGTFAAWCDSQHMEPEAVAADTLATFGGYLRARTLTDDIEGRLATTARVWRRAATLIPSLPAPGLKPPSRSRRYTLPPSSFPASYQAEAQAFLGSLAGDGQRSPFGRKDARKVRRPRTVARRADALRQASSALVILGRAPSTVTGLRDLVTKEAFEAILTHYWARACRAQVVAGKYNRIEDVPVEEGVTQTTRAIADTLLLVARYLGIPAEEMEQLEIMAADMRPQRHMQMTARNRQRLDKLTEPEALDALLRLPERLMGQAEEMVAGNTKLLHKAALLARRAAAIELLLNIPLRIANLVGLELHRHLQFGDRDGRITRIRLMAAETKNDADLEWAVSPELASFLARYLTRFHLHFAAGGCVYLFPGRGGRQPMSIDGMRYNIERTIWDYVGVACHPHLFRALLARLHLSERPEALEDVRQLLGDKTLAVVLGHYVALQPERAARRYAQTLHKLRTEVPTDQPVQPRKPMKGRGKGTGNGKRRQQ